MPRHRRRVGRDTAIVIILATLASLPILVAIVAFSSSPRSRDGGVAPFIAAPPAAPILVAPLPSRALIPAVPRAHPPRVPTEQVRGSTRTRPVHAPHRPRPAVTRPQHPVRPAQSPAAPPRPTESAPAPVESFPPFPALPSSPTPTPSASKSGK